MGEGFQQNYLATLGAEFVIKEYNNNQLLIWDLGGHRNFMKIFEAYLQGGQGLILVFDVMRPETLESISGWIDYFIKANGKIAPGIVVANKIDLRASDTDWVQEHEVQKYLDELFNKFNHKFQYIETSALTGENIEKAFENLVDDLVDHHTI
jgi:small GTP-binding protein